MCDYILLAVYHFLVYLYKCKEGHYIVEELLRNVTSRSVWPSVVACRACVYHVMVSACFLSLLYL